MKKTIMMLFTGLIILSSCNTENGNATTDITNNVDSVSYALGANFGSNVLRQVESAGDTTLNYDAMVSGFSEALKEKDLLVDELTGTRIINEYMRSKDEERKAADQDKFSENVSLSEAFFGQNKNKEGVIETESGLQYEVVTLGEGELPLDGDRVSVNYEGTTLNGEVFDSSYERGESAIFGINMAESQIAQNQELINEVANNPEAQNELLLVIQEIQNLPLANLIIMFIFFFIGGYLLYSSLYAAIGAAVDNETDTQQFMLPIIMPLILAIYVGFFTN